MGVFVYREVDLSAISIQITTQARWLAQNTMIRRLWEHTRAMLLCTFVLLAPFAFSWERGGAIKLND